MSITVHFHAAAGNADTTGDQMAMRPVEGKGSGMDAGASLPAAGSDGMAHVDSPATAIDGGGPPAELVSMVEAAFARRASGEQAGADKASGERGNDAGAAPAFI